MSVVPACPGLFSVKIGGSSLQRPEMKGTHGYTCFFLPSKPRARVTPPLLDGHPVHGTSGALGSGLLPTPRLVPVSPPSQRAQASHPVFLWSFSFLCRTHKPPSLEPFKSKSTASAGSHGGSRVAQMVGFKLQPDPGPLYNKCFVSPFYYPEIIIAPHHTGSYNSETL